MQIFDEIKTRGVEDVAFISMDGVSGLEEEVKVIFPQVVLQRCIVHLIRNSIKYIPSKDYKGFTAKLKKIYCAVNLKTAIAEFDRFKETWKHYPGAVAVWERNWIHVEQKKDPDIDQSALSNREKAVIIDVLKNRYSLPLLLQKS